MHSWKSLLKTRFSKRMSKRWQWVVFLALIFIEIPWSKFTINEIRKNWNEMFQNQVTMETKQWIEHFFFPHIACIKYMFYTYSYMLYMYLCSQSESHPSDPGLQLLCSFEPKFLPAIVYTLDHQWWSTGVLNAMVNCYTFFNFNTSPCIYQLGEVEEPADFIFMCVKECKQLLIVSVSRQRSACLFPTVCDWHLFLSPYSLTCTCMHKNHDRHASGHHALFMILHLV